jgi:tRNA(Ile)-lysidine synthase
MKQCSIQQPINAVAYSGGADSTALLLETWQENPSSTIAFHIHHGLQDAGDDFVIQCEKFCHELKIPLYISYVNANPDQGKSPEDAARRARYAALIDMAHQHGVVESGGSVLVAQHANDQIETFMIAMSRGSGLAGLAAMPSVFTKGGVTFKRPFLHHSSEKIRGHLHVNNISFIEDPSNQDKKFTRNKIRHDLMPELKKAFPQYLETFSRSINHIANSDKLLSEYAKFDLDIVGNPPSIKLLQTISASRQGNCLRYWLKTAYNAIPSTAQLDELLKQISARKTKGHSIKIKVSHGFVFNKNDVLNFESISC